MRATGSSIAAALRRTLYRRGATRAVDDVNTQLPRSAAGEGIAGGLLLYHFSRNGPRLSNKQDSQHFDVMPERETKSDDPLAELCRANQALRPPRPSDLVPLPPYYERHPEHR